MEQKTIYIVTEGSYSDYTIKAVFDDKELADKYASVYHDADVEEYDINSEADKVKQGLILYSLKMLKDGTATDIYTRGYDTLKETQSSIHGGYVSGSLEHVLYLYVRCLAKDEQHAIKIANEIRLQRIAGNQWNKN